MTRQLSIIAFIFCSFFLAEAQDIHFSQFYASPLTISPALTGMNGSDYRVGVNFRSQWSSVSDNNTYRTTSAFADLALGRPTYYSNYFCIGLVFFSDQAGDLNYNTNKVDVSLAYHIVSDRKRAQSFSVGIQGGFGHRKLDLSKAIYGNQFSSSTGVFDPTINGDVVGADNFMYGDVGLGLLYSNSPTKKSNFNLGMSVSHLNQPNLTMHENASENDHLFMKFTMHGRALIPLKKSQLSIIPDLLILKQGPSSSYNLSGYLKYNFSIIPTNRNAFYFGLMYRVQDAMILASRIEINKFNIGLSYDMNVSKLRTATNVNGGLEISLSYTGSTNKKPSVRYCPAF